MAKQSARPEGKGVSDFFPPRGDGHQVHNQILLALPRNERERLLPKLELVRLQPHLILHEVGDILQSAYFCNTGLISILSVFPDGKSVEVGLVSKEGFVGLPLVAGFRSAATRAVAQIEGTAFRLSADALTGILRECVTLDAAAVFIDHGDAGDPDCSLQPAPRSGGAAGQMVDDDR